MISLEVYLVSVIMVICSLVVVFAILLDRMKAVSALQHNLLLQRKRITTKRIRADVTSEKMKWCSTQSDTGTASISL